MCNSWPWLDAWKYIGGSMFEVYFVRCTAFERIVRTRGVVPFFPEVHFVLEIFVRCWHENPSVNSVFTLRWYLSVVAIEPCCPMAP